MMKPQLDRRKFIGALSMGTVGIALGIPTIATASNARPAVLGGPKANPETFPTWPVFDQTEEKALTKVLNSRAWGRGNGTAVANFEKQFAALLNAKHCLGVSSGTSSLYTMLGALEVGPGDEVVIPVYTFVATYNVVVLNYALPVFADTDIETFQIDAAKIESSISPQTRVIMPVHMGGSPVDVDKVLDVAGKANIPVIEDACQAHLAEWRGRKVGTWGLAGGYSLQASKNLNSGEGGIIVTNDDQFAEYCSNFQNQGQKGRATISYKEGAGTRATNMRMTEFQGGLLQAQMTRLQEQSDRRNANAQYLTKLLSGIKGISPARLYEGATRSAWHLYMFRYDKNLFAGLTRDKFMEALRAEGVPCSGGYGMMNKDRYVTELANNKHYLKIYGQKTMNEWLERNQCPQNDQLCEQAIWFTQNLLLGTKTQMEQIAEGIQKIQKYAREIAGKL
jgi:perosamine synthetase